MIYFITKIRLGETGKSDINSLASKRQNFILLFLNRSHVVPISLVSSENATVKKISCQAPIMCLIFNDGR